MREVTDQNRVRFGPYEADLRTHELWKFGTKIKLAGQPFAVLEVLLSRPGELVTREDLRERLWPGETFVDFNHGLNAAVNKLRDALSDSAEKPKYIETLPRRGYRFIGTISRDEVTAAEVLPVLATAPATEPPMQGVPALTVTVEEAPVPSAPAEVAIARPPRKRLRGVLLAVAALIAVLVVVQLWEKQQRPVVMYVAGPQQSSRVVLISGPGKNEAPQFSPDGKKLAFMSTRSGGQEIWVADADGSNARQVTFVGDAGTPRWSPDGRSIVFDSGSHRPGAILEVELETGQTRYLVVGNANNVTPSWSHDGKSIYFASDRTGRYEVWKMSSGRLMQITGQGGFAPLESDDGQYIYYAKTNVQNPQVWRVRSDGDGETLLSPEIRPTTWASWWPNNGGIYFVSSMVDNIPQLNYFDLKSHRLTQLGVLLEHFPFWLSVSPEGKTAAIDSAVTEQESIIVGLQGFQIAGPQ